MTTEGATDLTTVNVELGERSYPILVGSGVLAQLGARLRDLFRPSSIHVVSNPTVAALYWQRTRQVLSDAGFTPNLIEIPDGEQHKNLSTLTLLFDRILESGAERSSPVIALGGGVVGDVTGFAAATSLRGLPFVQVPTTLLAQVDSSVGGKTAVNHRSGKNLIGAFYQPRLVVIDIETLSTLPRRELLAGLAEVIKYGIILDREFFDLIEARLPDLLALQPELTREIVARCCAIKAMVVGKDERETDLRAILNFGHTVGHGLEAVTEYKRYLHGEAIAIGMVAAAKLSARLGLCGSDEVERIRSLLERAGLPVDLPAEIPVTALTKSIAHDKKAAAGKVRFVCMEAIGKTRFESVSPADIVRLLAD